MAAPQSYGRNLQGSYRCVPGFHVFSASMSPRLPRGPDLNEFSYLIIIVSTAVPCSLTLEIQERIISHRPRHARTRRHTPCAALFRIVWNAYPCTCPPCLLACDGLSRIIIHNIAHHPMLINIRNTGFNNQPRLSLPAKPTPTMPGTLIESPCSCGTGDTTRWIHLPCPLTLEIQDRIVLLHRPRQTLSAVVFNISPISEARSPAASRRRRSNRSRPTCILAFYAFLPSIMSHTS